MEPGRPAPSGSQADPALDFGVVAPAPSLEGFSGFNAEKEAILVPRGDFSQFPPEIIETIFFLLSPEDLSNVGATCRRLADHSKNERLWHNHVQKNVPGCVIKSPSPYKSWQELYIAYDPYWFLTKHKLWFSDFIMMGKLIMVRYDPRSGCIEGYRVVVERNETRFESWQHDDAVIIHSFEPMVQLHKDLPIVRLDKPIHSIPEQGRYSQETTMNVSDHSPPLLLNNIALVQPIDVLNNIALVQPIDEMPTMPPWQPLWPPLIIPARHRIRNDGPVISSATRQKPQKRSHVSDQSFRIRLSVYNPQAHGLRRGAMEMVQTYSTLEPKLYTPTADKPFRGIWVGDYNAHGSEFLLLHQPDDKVPFDENSVVRREGETEEEYLKRKREERIYRGRIEAIKLTGDPNIPRGEFTFLVEDLGKDGLIRVAQESQFRGARIVRSRGHIAEEMFRNDTYIDCQLIMISTDLLAQYWEGMGHISFFERVNIDGFLNPYEDPAVRKRR